MELRVTLMCGLLLSSSWALAQDQAQQNLRQQQQQEQNWHWHQMQQEAVQQQQMPPSPPRPTGEWIKTWGAIAEGKSKPGYSGIGRVTGELTKEEAEARALGDCRLFGGSECVVLVAYYDECVAVVDGPEGTTVGGAFATGPSMKVAGVRALSYCSKRNNGADCKIDYIRCSEPTFKRY
jgi:hypothetical protein